MDTEELRRSIALAIIDGLDTGPEGDPAWEAWRAVHAIQGAAPLAQPGERIKTPDDLHAAIERRIGEVLTSAMASGTLLASASRAFVRERLGDEAAQELMEEWRRLAAEDDPQ